MIGLAWLASSTWVLPVLTWHHVEFGGVRQSEVRGGNDLYKQKQKRDLKNTLKEEKNKQRKTIHLYERRYFFSFRETSVKQNLQALALTFILFLALYLKVQTLFLKELLNIEASGEK